MGHVGKEELTDEVVLGPFGAHLPNGEEHHQQHREANADSIGQPAKGAERGSQIRKVRGRPLRWRALRLRLFCQGSSRIVHSGDGLSTLIMCAFCARTSGQCGATQAIRNRQNEAQVLEIAPPRATAYRIRIGSNPT